MASVTVILSWCLMTVCLKNVLSVRFRTVGLQTPIPPGHCGAECIKAEEKRAGYQSAEVYASLTQAKCARESVQE
ncbi:hypothetical protein ACN66_00965 [Escherichia coli]|nr:hypothetical protein ACN66_00965 [Escherichia coli]OKT37311.1 hypothetical protein ACN63_21300 [Escherichia coli]OKT49449.1 hypothetical protein ACN64_26685 [Escherichia coli]